MPEKLHRLPIESGSRKRGSQQQRRRPVPAAAAIEDGDVDDEAGALAAADDLWGDHHGSEVEGGQEEEEGSDDEEDKAEEEEEEEEKKDEDHAAPPPAHPDPRPPALRLGRGEALCGWFGPHAIIQLKSGGYSIWCGRHSNLSDSYKCKADCSGALSNDEKLVRLKRWIVLGYNVDEEDCTLSDYIVIPLSIHIPLSIDPSIHPSVNLWTCLCIDIVIGILHMHIHRSI